MSEPLYLEKERAEQIINNVKAQIDQLETTAKTIDKLIVSELPTAWKGVSASKTQSTYQEEYKTFLQRNVPDMVTALKDYMQQCVKSIAEVDRQLSGK